MIAKFDPEVGLSPEQLFQQRSPNCAITVGALIAALKRFDQDLRVVVDGREGGLDDICATGGVTALIGANKDRDYSGKHLFSLAPNAEKVLWLNGQKPLGRHPTPEDLPGLKEKGVW